MVYFIRSGTRYVKIGYTDDYVEKRLQTLQAGNPLPLYVAAVADGAGRAAEIRLHEIFREERVRGEWFKVSPRLDKLIGWLRESPDRLDEYMQRHHDSEFRSTPGRPKRPKRGSKAAKIARLERDIASGGVVVKHFPT